MFIAFEGPDEVGKSTSARALSYDGQPIYNATKQNHAEAAASMVEGASSLVQTFDRIDWLSHMVYRLAMPTRDWNDDRLRTVFAMPDTHLVLKMHRPDMAGFIDAVGEGYETGSLSKVNEMYYHQIDFLMRLNSHNEYSWFRTVSIMEVVNNSDAGIFRQRLVAFDSPAIGWGTASRFNVNGDQKLLELLRYEEQQRL